MLGSSLELPPGYYLDKDPDILVLRRLDGAMVGAVIDYLRSLVDTMMAAHDRLYVGQNDFEEGRSA